MSDDGMTPITLKEFQDWRSSGRNSIPWSRLEATVQAAAEVASLRARLAEAEAQLLGWAALLGFPEEYRDGHLLMQLTEYGRGRAWSDSGAHKDLQAAERERDEWKARAEKAENFIVTGRHENEARQMLGEVLRHSTNEHGGSIGVVEVQNATSVVMRICAERDAALSREDALAGQLQVLRDLLVEADDWLAQAKVNAGGLGSTRRRISEALASTSTTATEYLSRERERIVSICRALLFGSHALDPKEEAAQVGDFSEQVSRVKAETRREALEEVANKLEWHAKNHGISSSGFALRAVAKEVRALATPQEPTK